MKWGGIIGSSESTKCFTHVYETQIEIVSEVVINDQIIMILFCISKLWYLNSEALESMY